MSSTKQTKSFNHHAKDDGFFQHRMNHHFQRRSNQLKIQNNFFVKNREYVITHHSFYMRYIKSKTISRKCLLSRNDCNIIYDLWFFFLNPRKPSLLSMQTNFQKLIWFNSHRLNCVFKIWVGIGPEQKRGSTPTQIILFWIALWVIFFYIPMARFAFLLKTFILDLLY